MIAALALASAIQVGSLTLTPCGDAPSYYCGSLSRALDPSGQVPGTVAVAFKWLPHSDSSQPSGGTIVAAEGGPGFPSGESRDGYQALFAPLLTHRDLLLMDNRGTGHSDAIDCEPLQSAKISTLAAVTACANVLGDKSDLYGSGLAADDLDAILTALHVASVDLYGDSYGTFFAQTFALRHPARVREMVLDAAYPVRGGDPWYPATAPTIRQTFDLVCRRDPHCAALPGSSEARIEALLRALRKPHAPIAATDLALVMDTAGLNAISFRDTDAAARAYLQNGDAVPLRRLVREAYRYEEMEPRDPAKHSEGLFVANTCSDGPTAYDMNLAPRERTLQWERLLADKRTSEPNLYAPFTVDEFMAMPPDYSYVPLCQTWPVASPSQPQGQPVPADAALPQTPVLVLGGDLDTTTTPPEGDRAARLYPHAQRVLIVNTGHVTAIDDVFGCASGMVRAFFSDRTPDTACANRIPAMHLVPAFATTVLKVEPARPVKLDRETATDLRVAAAAVLAAGDAVARAGAYDIDAGSGLRGGTFSASHVGESNEAVHLHRVGWTSDELVSGTIAYNPNTGLARARLQVSGLESGGLSVTWHAYGSGQSAHVAGVLDGRTVNATMPSP